MNIVSEMGLPIDHGIAIEMGCAQSWASLYWFWILTCFQCWHGPSSVAKMVHAVSKLWAGWRPLTRSHCPSHTPTRSINAPNAGRSCNCRLVHTQELKSMGSQWRGDKPTRRQHTTSYDMTSYSITISYVFSPKNYHRPLQVLLMW